MSWTDERVELLKKLWTDGLSASQIASRMGGLTRNAVIGKVHRLGLSGRTRPARPRAPKPRHSVPSRTHRHPTAGKLALRQDKILDDEVGIEPEPQPTPINPISAVSTPWFIAMGSSGFIDTILPCRLATILFLFIGSVDTRPNSSCSFPVTKPIPPGVPGGAKSEAPLSVCK